MNCAEVQEFFSEYLDGRLAPPQAAPLKEHLGACAACRQELADLRRTIELIGSVEEIEASPDFLVEVNRKIDGGIGTGRLWRWIFTPAKIKLPLEAAALATVAVFAVYLYRSSELSQEISFFAQKSSEKAEEARHKAELDPVGQAEHSRSVLAYKELGRKEAPQQAPEAPQAQRPTQSPPTDLGDLTAGTTEKAEPYAAFQAREAHPPAPRAPAPLLKTPSPPPQVVEVKSEDLELFQRRVREVLAALTGRIVGEQASEEGWLLSVELPESREQDFRSAMINEAEATSPRTAAAKGLSQAEQRARSPVSPAQRGVKSEAKTTAAKDESTVTIQIRVWAKR